MNSMYSMKKMMSYMLISCCFCLGLLSKKAEANVIIYSSGHSHYRHHHHHHNYAKPQHHVRHSHKAKRVVLIRHGVRLNCIKINREIYC